MNKSPIRGLPTLPIVYKEFRYHINGEKEGAYQYFIRRPDGNTISSNEKFSSVVTCGQAARKQIDLLIATGLYWVEPTDEPPIANSSANKIQNTGNYFPDLKDAIAHGLFQTGNKPKKIDLYRAIAEFNSKAEQAQ